MKFVDILFKFLKYESMASIWYMVAISIVILVLGFIFVIKSTSGNNRNTNTGNNNTNNYSNKNKNKQKQSNNTSKPNKKNIKTTATAETISNPNTTTKKEISPITSPTPISPPLLSSTTGTNTIETNPLFLKTVKGFGESIGCIRFSPDSKYLAVSGNDRFIKIFLIEGLFEKKKVAQHFNLQLPFDEASCISFGQKCIYAALKDSHKLICFNILDQKNQQGKSYEMAWSVSLDIDRGSTIKSICSEINSPYILTCGDDTIVKIWTTKGQLIQTINTGQIKNYMASVTPQSGKYFGVAAFSSEVKIYEAILKKDGVSLDQCKRVMSLSGYKTNINSICFSNDSKVITSSIKDESIRLWNLNVKYQLDVDPESVYSIKSENGPIELISISPDSSVFAGVNQHSIAFYNLSNGSLIEKITIPPQSGSINTIAWSNDSKYLLTAGSDKLIYIWNKPNYKK